MLDERGFEIPDPTPVSMPTRLRLPQSRAQQIQAFIRHELSQKASQDGHESFEEANDLDVDDLADFPFTIYEEEGDPNFQSASEEVNSIPPGSEKPGGTAPVEGAEGEPKEPE